MDKEKLEEENNRLKKQVEKLSRNGIRNIDTRLESIERKLEKIEDCFRHLFNQGRD